METADRMWSHALLALGISAAIFVLHLFRRAYLTPLRSLPGPWHAKFTSLVLTKAAVLGRKMHYIHSLHEKYGPVVRIGPNEIDVADAAGFKEIHRVGSGFIKSEWYVRFRHAPVEDVFALVDTAEHAKRRKLYARPFSKSALRVNWEESVRERAKLVVDGIMKEARDNGGLVDVCKWWTMMAADVISLVSFGESFDQLRTGKLVNLIPILERLMQWSGIGAESPLLFRIYGLFSSRFKREVHDATELTLKNGARAAKNARARNIGQANIFHNVIAENEKDASALDDTTIMVEAQGLLAAGSGTTSVTMTYLVWTVLKHSHVARRLEQEVAALPEEYDDAMIEQLPYLNAVIDEVLRLHGAAPGSLPRVCPQKDTVICGHPIPAGTEVCSQPYSVHRNGEVFPNPHQFLPERWLDSTNRELIARQRAALVPFGGGSRTCLGMHLAMMELRYATAEFFRRCAGARLGPAVTDDSMEMVNYFLIRPKAEELMVDLGL